MAVHITANHIGKVYRNTRSINITSSHMLIMAQCNTFGATFVYVATSQSGYTKFPCYLRKCEIRDKKKRFVKK